MAFNLRCDIFTTSILTSDQGLSLMHSLDALRMLIEVSGGFLNSRAHFDRAYTATTSDFEATVKGKKVAGVQGAW